MSFKIGKSDFIRSVATLTTGTVLAQIISYFIYPLLTRIYTPEEMGDLGIYTRFVAFIASYAAVRYEVALPIPKLDQHAFSLYRLSLRIARVLIITTLLIGLIYCVLAPVSSYSIYFIILAVFGGYVAFWINIGTAWSIRNRAFKQISYQRITNAVSVNGLRYVFGVLSWGKYGILLGSFLGALLSILGFIKTFFTAKKKQVKSDSIVRRKVLSKEYSNFPRYNLPHVLMDLGIDLLVAGLIISFFGKTQFGYFSHAYLMMRVPLSLLGQSIGQVFYNRASEATNQGNLVLPLVRKTTLYLFLLSVVPFAIVFCYGESIFAFVFGQEWKESGRIASLLTPFLALNFLTSPISSLPLLFGKQRQVFVIGILVGILQLFCFGFIPVAVNLAVQLGLVSNRVDLFEWTIQFNVFCMVLVSLYMLFLYYRFAKDGDLLKHKKEE